MDMKSVHVCDELIEEILSRLPVKSLLRFRCVSKSWLSLIDSERFIEAHRQTSTQNSAFSHHKVMFACGGDVFKQCSLQQLLNEPSSVKRCRINAPINNGGSYVVVGCCNGLFCLFLHLHGVLILWNPATMVFMELSYLNCCFECSKFGFGWDGTSGAFKVFASSFTCHAINGIRRTNIYSSKTNSWKAVDHGCLFMSHGAGVFACGKIHWLTHDYIESFDLETEEFGRIELPTDKKFRDNKLAEIGGCLHLLCNRVDSPIQSQVVVVWVLKESGWLKLFTFRPVVENRYVAIRALFGGGPNGEIVLILGDNFLVYNGKDGIVHQASKNIEYCRGCVYVETLVSPNFTTPRAW